MNTLNLSQTIKVITDKIRDELREDNQTIDKNYIFGLLSSIDVMVSDIDTFKEKKS